MHSSQMVRYFCCRLTPNGIGDLISQVQRIYNLGRSFGLEFVFRELPRNRWSPDLDESDFLGLALGERTIEEFPDHEIVSVDGGLASYALLEGRPLESVLPANIPKRAIIEFVHSGNMYSNGIPVPIRYGIDLRAKLIQRHGRDAVSPKRSDQLSICVHIRQGDCTWVKRGAQHVFLGKAKITSDPNDADLERAPAVDTYTPLLDALTSRLDGRPYALRIYTDGPTNEFEGFANGRGRLLYELSRREERLIDWLRLRRPDNPLRRLYNPMSDAVVRREYEQVAGAAERLAGRYPNATLISGTSGALTASAILAFASADIVVITRNRWVFPLLGLGDERQAVLIVNSPVDENMKLFDDFSRARATETTCS